MNYLMITGTLTLALLLSACGNDDKPEGVIPDGYKSAVNKAESVEGELQDAARVQLENLDQAGD